jgi:hypothetical protein
MGRELAVSDARSLFCGWLLRGRLGAGVRPSSLAFALGTAVLDVWGEIVRMRRQAEA